MCAVAGCPGAVGQVQVLELLGQSLRGLPCAGPPGRHMVRWCSVGGLGPRSGQGVGLRRHRLAT